MVVLISAPREVLRVVLLNSRHEHKKVLEKSCKVELFGNQLTLFFAISVAREQDPRWRMK